MLPISTGAFSDRLTCSREYPFVLTLAMLLPVISTAPRSASIAPRAIPRDAKRLPMGSAFLHCRCYWRGGFGRTRVSHRVPHDKIHENVDRPSRAAQVRRVNLIQPANFRLRLSDILRHARKAFRPPRIFLLPGHVTASQSKLRRAGLLQRMDSWMQPLDLLAQLFLFGDSPVHSVQIERHKFRAAIHEL